MTPLVSILIPAHDAARTLEQMNEGQPPAAPRARSAPSVVSGAASIERVCGDSAENPVYTPTAVVGTAAQKAVGGYSKVLPHAADLHMWLRLARLGSVAFLQAYQAVYRRHGANMHYSYVGVPNLQRISSRRRPRSGL
jgi:hypothetical protein